MQIHSSMLDENLEATALNSKIVSPIFETENLSIEYMQSQQKIAKLFA